MSETDDTTEHDRAGPDARVLQQERGHLLNVCYRLLGSLSEAEDVAQEAFTRWYALSPQDRRAIMSPGAWLTTVASRICLDILRSARARRERYVGQWLPEPLPDRSLWTSTQSGSALDPADRVSLDESITMAFLVVLDTLAPAERVAFILHDVFGYPFADIAEMVGRTPAACRQLASQARQRLRDAQPPTAPQRGRASTIRAFRSAWAAHDIDALVDLLDPYAAAVADGGGRASARTDPIVGARPIAQAFIDILTANPDLHAEERTVNGATGLVLQQGVTVVTVIAFEITHERITRIWAVRNPDKLRSWTADHGPN